MNLDLEILDRCFLCEEGLVPTDSFMLLPQFARAVCPCCSKKLPVGFNVKKPVRVGEISCRHCTYSWEPIFPEGTKILQCPSCTANNEVAKLHD